jgi:glycosyltransferase involved in cell wall biosynthesis
MPRRMCIIPSRKQPHKTNVPNIDRPQIKVLLFAPEPSLGGGVAAFDQLLRSTLGSSIHTEQFVAGRRPGAVGGAFRFVTPFYDATRLAWRLITRRYDVYHLNPSLDSRAALRDGLFMLVLRLFRQRQVLVFIRGWDAGFYRRIATSPVATWLFRFVYGHAARILVLASSFADDLAALGIQRDRVHGATTMFDGDLLASVSRNRKDSQFIIVFLARLIAPKGVYELLEAFLKLSQRSPRYSLVMAGNGPELGAIRAWCADHGLQDRVQLPGHVDGKDKARLLSNADLFVLPTYHGEGCPNALLEAMGAGLPVIVTSVGGIPDIVQDGVNGIFVTPGDSNGIADAIESLSGDDMLRNGMSESNRRVAWEKYEARSVTRCVESHYQAIIE